MCFLVVLSIAGWHAAQATPLEVQVLDKSGAAVRGVVVTVNDGHIAATPVGMSGHHLVMDQLNMMFEPQVLIVPVGAAVNFPNSDSVNHQIYSFSSPKRFQLSLYKGTSHPPVIFDKPGLVVLGCNIHDSMVGYVYVTEASWYGQTDAQGKLTLNNVATGTVTVTIWSPLVADAPSSLIKTMQLIEGDGQSVVFRLTKSLRPSPEPKPRHSDWDY